MKRATVYSIYMDNVPPAVVRAQRSVVEQFLPEGWKFTQYASGDCYSHPAAMTICTAMNQNPITVFLDIDCIPLSRAALELLAERASHGILVGAAQRANHIQNGAHLFVGPCCMAFDNQRYAELGSPSFYETGRGDVAEEVTWRWQERMAPIYLLYPSRVRSPLWDLTDGQRLGLGTEYESKFYHEFCIRAGGAGGFIARCEEVLNSNLRGVSA